MEKTVSSAAEQQQLETMATLKAQVGTIKARYWCGVGYPENMIPDWEDQMPEILQLPYAFSKHDKDIDKNGDLRKIHAHVMIVCGNTTTQRNALEILNGLSAPGKIAFSTVEKVNNVRYMYNYLIHDTDDARKKHKYQYDPSERITGNNFDIGSFEQLTLADKEAILRELELLILTEGYTNYADFFGAVASNYPADYAAVVRANSAHFGRLTKGMYQRLQQRN